MNNELPETKIDEKTRIEYHLESFQLREDRSDFHQSAEGSSTI